MVEDSKAAEMVLAQIDLSQCPSGKVLDFRDPDKDLEETVFKDWHNPLEWGPKQAKRPSSYRVVPDGGMQVLEHHNMHGRCLTTGEPLWADYAIEASVRQLNPYTVPSMDEPHAIVGLTELIVRYQDLRRYYLFGIEGHERFVLYRREDGSWLMLAERHDGLDRSRYYHLRVVCEGRRFECYVDDQLMFVAYDEKFERQGRYPHQHPQPDAWDTGHLVGACPGRLREPPERL